MNISEIQREITMRLGYGAADGDGAVDNDTNQGNNNTIKKYEIRTNLSGWTEDVYGT